MAISTTFKNASPVVGLYGLVICGGKSSRMGTDKSMLDYHGKPQCYHIYEMLSPLCEKVFISCNEEQADKIRVGYHSLTDIPCFTNSGPVAGLLTAFDHFPNNNFLIIGCDYPFLNTKDLLDFLPFCNQEHLAAAFYNEKNNLYEPLLAYYGRDCRNELLNMFATGEYSLQHFLKKIPAAKFCTESENITRSIDTKAGFEEAKHLITLNEE